MYRHYSPALLALSVAVTLASAAIYPTPAVAQGFLRRLEQRVQGVLDEAARRTDLDAPTGRDSEGGRSGVGYLGMTAEEHPESGIVEVVVVKPGSPAQSAGLQVGDQLLTLDGRDLRSLEQLSGSLGQKGPGAKVNFGVLREGRRESIRVTLSTRPEPRGDARSSPRSVLRGSNDERPDLDRPQNDPASETRVPGESQSVLRRLERSLTPNARPAATQREEPIADDLDVVPPTRRNATNVDEENAELRAEVATLQRRLTDLQRRIDQLEKLLTADPAADDSAPLPEPKP
ncbi:MAG: PDZ domain-containing protein [Pirellulales bacterium]